MIRLHSKSSRCFKAESFTLLVVLFLHLHFLAFSQQYGLRFSGAEVPQHQRTALDLSPNTFLSVKDGFSLSFQLSFPQGLHRYYGYIFRIVDDNNNNIDLVFNYRGITSTSLNIIYGSEQTNIAVTTDLSDLFENWEDIELHVDFKEQTVTFMAADTTIVAENILLRPKIKVLFGKNNYEQFKTVDVPPMRIRDISLYQGHRLLHHWPLNESNGNQANDTQRGRRASVENPTWVRRLYENWDNVFSDTISGQASVAFNNNDGSIYFIGQDQLIAYRSLQNQSETIGFDGFPDEYLQGRQAYYDSLHDRLVLFNMWNATFDAFNFDLNTWDRIHSLSDHVAVYWHYNKHFSEKDNALLVFGGYGQYEFRNIVQRFYFTDYEYDTIQTSGDIYYPRYLAALGSMGDTLFLLGGHGSVSGRQIENPTGFFDLTTYSLEDHTFTKRYEFSPPIEDAVFANSMVIDEASETFYAMVFPYYEHHSHLQLVRGMLHEPGFEPVGDRIPFRFEDISSFIDLYYSELSKKLITVTLFYDNSTNRTYASVYTISFPPNPNTFMEGKQAAANIPVWVVYVLIMAIFTLIAIGLYWYIRKRRMPEQACKETQQPDTETLAELPADNESADLSLKNTILFFGGFKIFNHIAEDITNKFSPLLKEFFLLIWLHSLHGRNGVSSKKLKEIFWFHKDDKKAINNRAVNIAKLKCLLEEVDTCKVSRRTGYWKIEFDKQVVYNDFVACLNLANNKKLLNKRDIVDLISIIDKGAFLEDLSYEWLDVFKAEVSNLIIDTLVEFGLSYDINKDPDFMLQLADVIFHFDIVNEEAMIFKCKSLYVKGKHSLANNCYLEFLRNYKSLYDEEFKKSFAEIIK